MKPTIFNTLFIAVTINQVIEPESGAVLGPYKSGEICTLSPQVMKGYLNNPDATLQTIDRDGWLHTGKHNNEEGYKDSLLGLLLMGLFSFTHIRIY